MVSQKLISLRLFKTIIASLSFFSLFFLSDPCLLYGSSPYSHSRDQLSYGLKDCHVRLLGDRDYFPALIHMIGNAKREIVMSFFLFKTNGYRRSYSDKILNHLIQASKRGVSIKVLLETGKDPGSNVNKNNRNTAKRLKKGGIHVYFDSPRITTHTKVMVIDRRYIIMGSHNLTNSALKYNHEISIFVDSPAVAEETLRYINSLYK